MDWHGGVGVGFALAGISVNTLWGGGSLNRGAGFLLHPVTVELSSIPDRTSSAVRNFNFHVRSAESLMQKPGLQTRLTRSCDAAVRDRRTTRAA